MYHRIVESKVRSIFKQINAGNDFIHMKWGRVTRMRTSEDT